MRNNEPPPATIYHKEEVDWRMQVDSQDWRALCDKVEICIDPLDPVQHPMGLVNIATGRVVMHQSVNVENAVTIGKSQMELYEKGWPESFHSTLPKRVFTMAITCKHVNMGEAKVFDTETIHARAIGLQSSGGSLDMDTLSAHEQA